MYIFYIKLSILVTQQSDVLSKLTYILFIHPTQVYFLYREYERYEKHLNGYSKSLRRLQFKAHGNAIDSHILFFRCHR